MDPLQMLKLFGWRNWTDVQFVLKRVATDRRYRLWLGAGFQIRLERLDQLGLAALTGRDLLVGSIRRLGVHA